MKVDATKKITLTGEDIRQFIIDGINGSNNFQDDKVNIPNDVQIIFDIPCKLVITGDEQVHNPMLKGATVYA
jgi:hypothetical protein